MKIGIACGYSWDVVGGVQLHIRDLARELIRRGHEVSVIAPSEKAAEELESYVVPAGAAIPIRYNGSVARLAFGPRVNAVVRNWLAEGDFDVLHVHEPFSPSVSMLALVNAKCPVVSTFHLATDRSRALEVSARFLVPMLDKIQARIAVSQEARRTAVQHFGADAWVIPNGVQVGNFQTDVLDSRFCGTPQAPTLAFLGRIDEPRKGLPVVAQAFPAILAQYPQAKLFVAGGGDVEKARALFGPHAGSVEFLGMVSESDKVALLHSCDLYLAPNTGGESFGIILVEAMAAHAAIVASDIPAFRAVLEEGRCGFHFANEDASALAQTVITALCNPAERALRAQAGWEHSWRFDWGRVTTEIMRVYEAAVQMYHALDDLS